MNISTNYVAKTPDANGFIQFTEEENATWHELFTRQLKIVQNRACDEFMTGIQKLHMAAAHIPQCPEMKNAFKASTAWEVYPVDAIIPNKVFFSLLAERKFPAAAFIRRREELDYLKEPDIFHEYFGHCPMLTEPVYADFMQDYGKKALTASEQDLAYLARLYWFTVEFGLIQTQQGLRVYGGGILSSKEETVYCLESPAPQRLPLADGLAAMRTPYRIDILQPIYYIINSFQDIYHIMQNDVFGLIHRAQDMGDLPPSFDTEGLLVYR